MVIAGVWLRGEDEAMDDALTLRMEAGACLECKGSGKVRQVHTPPRAIFPVVPTLEECPTCEGRGELKGIAGT